MNKTNERATVLVIDDDDGMRDLLKTDLELRGYEVLCAVSANDALNVISEHNVEMVITDIRMPGQSGLQLCQQLKESRPDLPVVVMTAFGDMDTAIAAIRSGAYDFINKPVELELVAMTVRRAVERSRLRVQVRLLEQQIELPAGFPNMLGESEAMLELYDQLARVADSDASVLISGESGTGKEMVARAIHDRSDRASKPFVAINCGAISESLLESELFGHVKGAFTDARSERKGLFVEADGGTILLDELGDMPLAMQVKLLRALEEKRVRPVGGNREVSFNVRVVAASHVDLEAAVEENRIREDLFYRINVINLYMPPLRSRGSDVLLLAKHFLGAFAEKSEKNIRDFDENVADKLLSYNWPGNIRELRNVIERAVILAKHDRLIEEDLPDKIRTFTGKAVFWGSDDPTELLSLEEIQLRYIAHVLDAVDNNQTQAAKILKVDRKTLYRKLKSREWSN